MKKILGFCLVISLLLGLVMIQITPTVYADDEYVVSYDDDGNEETQNISVNLEAGSTIKLDFNDEITQAEEIELLENYEVENPIREGYNFVGWSEEETQEYDLELKANWQIKKYTITFNSNTEEPSTQVQEFDYNEEKELIPNSFINQGYEFIKWNTLQDGTGTDYEDEQSVKNLTDEDNANIDLYAQWRLIENYEVSYDDDGNSNTQNIVKTFVEKSKIKLDFNDGVTQEDEIELTENTTIQNPTREGYNFVGWSKEDDQEYDLKLKANWQIKKYTVTFYSNNGVVSKQIQEFEYNEEKELMPNSFIKQGYEFIRWNTLANGKGTNYENQQTVKNLVSKDNGNINLYAQWDIYRRLVKDDNKDGDITDELLTVLEESQNYSQSIITIQSGTYFIGDNSKLVIHSNTQLILQQGTELKAKNSNTRSIFRVKGTDTEKVQNVTITGGTINCNNACIRGIEIDSAQNIKVNNVKVVNAGSGRNGIDVRNSTKVYLIGTETSNNKNSGIYISNANPVYIKNSKSYSNAKNGVMVVGQSYVSINNLAAYSNTPNGIYVNNNSTVGVANSKLYQNTQDGIYINSSKATIKSTYCFSNSNHGVNAVTSSEVTGNVLTAYSNTKDGLHVNDSKAQITNGSFYKNKQHGIYTKSGKLNISIKTTKCFLNGQDGANIGSSTNVAIDGLTAYSNTRDGLHISGSKATILRSECKTNKNRGAYVSDSTVTFNTQNKMHDNTQSGLYITTKSTVTLKASTVYNNAEHGICVMDASKLYANTNNNIYSNNYNGISATKTGTQIYINKNIIKNNGKNAKTSGDGEKIGHGIGVTEGAYANITENTITGNGECGISVFDGASTRINKNTINKNGRHGIGAKQKISIKSFEGNTISNNKYHGVLLADEAKGGTFTKNTITNNTQYGISVIDKSNVTLNSNTITYNKKGNLIVSIAGANKTGAKVTLGDANYIAYSQEGHGTVLSGKTTLEITGNNNKIERNAGNGISVTGNSTLNIGVATTIYGNSNNGVYIKDSTAQIKSAKIRKNKKYGVCLENSGNLDIWKSTIKNNENYGINVSGKNATAKISTNEIKENLMGIVIKDNAKATEIKSNTISSNGEIGMMIRNSAIVETIKNNTIENHKIYGIKIKDATVKQNYGNKYNKNGKNVYQN